MKSGVGKLDAKIEPKPLVILSGEIKSPPFSAEARIEAGTLLRRLQNGELLSMPLARPMPSIGARCLELRIVDENMTWRIFCRTDDDAVLVVHVMAKRRRRHRKRPLGSARRGFRTTIQSEMEVFKWTRRKGQSLKRRE